MGRLFQLLLCSYYFTVVFVVLVSQHHTTSIIYYMYRFGAFLNINKTNDIKFYYDVFIVNY